MKHNGLTILKRFSKENDNFRRVAGANLNKLSRDAKYAILDNRCSLWSYVILTIQDRNISNETFHRIDDDWRDFIGKHGYYDRLVYRRLYNEKTNSRFSKPVFIISQKKKKTDD